MNKLRDISLKIYFAGLICLVVSLSFGNFPISVSQFILAGAWLLYPDYRKKFNTLFSNKAALVLISLYLLHVIGLLYTNEDFDYALKDLRIKLPLFLLPFIIGSLPAISKKQFNTLLYFFLTSLVVSSLICTAVRLGIYAKEVNTIRDISIYISHIRYSLLICLGIFFAFYEVLKKENSIGIKLSMAAVSVWLIVFLFILESPTGIGVLLAGIVTSAAIAAWNKKKPAIRIAMVLMLILLPAYAYVSVKSIYHELMTEVPVDESKLEIFTSDGGKYTHQLDRPATENGNRTWIYICWEELADSWNSRSKYDFAGEDKRGNLVKYTLVRYMTSKGLRKDAKGMQEMTEEDIEKVESGIANTKSEGLGNFRYRIYQLVWEYRNYMSGGDPSGHSLAMRFEYWKTTLGIIKSAPVIGVGTGDLPIAYIKYYEEHNSQLGEKWRRRAHNQFLSIAAAFGILGLLWFIFSLFYPGFVLNKFQDYHYFIFFLIAIISMLTEDTIESQVGVTFFAYFNSLLLLGISSGDRS